MKSNQMKLVVCYALAASLLLLAVSCGKPASENAVEEGIASISSETISEEMIASIAAAKHPSIGYFNTERDSVVCEITVEQNKDAIESMAREAEAAASRAADATKEATKAIADAEAYYASKEDVEKVPVDGTSSSSLQKPPSVHLQYQFVLRETTVPQDTELRLVNICYLYPATYIWTTEDANGTPIHTEEDNGRPCDYEKTSHLQLSRVADSDYIVDVSLAEKRIESYTLMAYSLEGGHYESGTPCTIRDGKLELFQTPHYYELTVQYTQGTAVYGFFVE